MNKETPLQRTSLYDIHVAAGARMVPFAGFEMPVQYSGIIDEHISVRRHAGLFDVSHMGEIIVSGSAALHFVQELVTNDAGTLVDGQAMYTVMCRPDAGIVDDLLVYRLRSDRYMLVINASNIESDFSWISAQNTAGVELDNISDRVGLLAIQGPDAFAIVNEITSTDISDLHFYHFVELEPYSFFGSSFAILSHTGYTGERGLEIYCDADCAPAVWEALMKSGDGLGLKPTGLGARDTLRLEAGYCLYGNDITTENNPLEAGLGWLTKLDKPSFIGRARLAEIKSQKPVRRLVGFVATARGIPRHGDDIVDASGSTIGTVTSGTQSPMIKRGIGLGYVANNPAFTTPGSCLKISARGRTFDVVVRRPPFHKQ